MNITFIGTGYVGLVSGTMLAELGHNVTCLDTNLAKIASLKSGISPIYEPGLDAYITNNVATGRLSFTSNYDEKLMESSAVFITVWTPTLESGEADLSYIYDAVNNLIDFINDDCVLVIKSTVPPGTCQKVTDMLRAKNLNHAVVSNPEFLKEGSAIVDFVSPLRIVVGANDKKAKAVLEQIYAPLTLKGFPLINTDPATSELIKYASNAFLATKLAFINEMANLCEKIPADIDELTHAMGLDSRIGKEFLKAGPGFGGSCFPKDIIALSTIAKNYNTDFQVLDAVIASNKERPSYMVEKIKGILSSLSGKNIAILGLTFKANTDDIRSSPAIEIASLISLEKANVVVFDPAGMDNAREVLEGAKFANSATEACINADAIIILTEWSEFKNLNYQEIYKSVKNPVIIDLRNLLKRDIIENIGFKYHSIG